MNKEQLAMIKKLEKENQMLKESLMDKELSGKLKIICYKRSISI